ncbi:MAG: DUF3592 domain-containing protein [Halapricum sp.]
MADPLALVGLPFLFAGLAVLWYGGRLAIGLVRRHRQTREVDAEIVDARAVEHDDGEFEPIVRFRYDFRGQTYESTLVQEGQAPPTGTREVIDSYLSNYPEGETTTATLLTSMPDQAVLERSTDTWPYVVASVATVLGLVFTVLGLGIFVGALLS